jgi:hypothetical protein
MDLWVDVCYAAAERNVLTMKVDGMGTRSSSKVIRFGDEVFVPKGFLCFVQLQILESCWYTKVSKPGPMTEFFSRDGQLLVNNVSFHVSGVGETMPKVCPISKILLRPVANDCILLQD